MRRWLAGALALVWAGQGFAADTVSEDALRRHIAALASDEMEGRKPGTPGGERAVIYIVAAMRDAGLRPGAADGGWLQPVALLDRQARSASLSWRTHGKLFAAPAGDLIFLANRSKARIERAPLIFGGYGIGGEDEGVAIAGAVVMLLPGQPEGAHGAPDFAARRARLAARGAAAIITLLPINADVPAIRRNYGEGRTTLANQPVAPIEGAMTARLWRVLALTAGLDAGDLERRAGAKDFRMTPIGALADLRARSVIQRYSAPNVIGRIAGAGDEAIVYMAHWDHLGICRAAGVRDRICNGAIDNASGVVLMIEVARALAEGPQPGRSLLFVASTAEESGLLGARAFIADPPTPRGQIIAAINFDTVAIAPRGEPVSIVGRGLTPLDGPVDATARALGRGVDMGVGANAYLQRQDGWEFMKAGVPAIMAGGSFTDTKRLDAFFAGRYHGPADALTPETELGGAAEDGAFHIALGRLLADPKRFPAPPR